MSAEAIYWFVADAAMEDSLRALDNRAEVDALRAQAEYMLTLSSETFTVAVLYLPPGLERKAAYDLFNTACNRIAAVCAPQFYEEEQPA